MKGKKWYILMVICMVMNMTAINAKAINKDEWYDWYNNLSDDEKLYVNYDPNGNSNCADDYSNFIESESVANDYELKESDGKLYCIDSKGNFITGWIEINDNEYYFKKDGSAVRKNTTINGIRYKFNSDGICEGKYSGWVKKSGKYYYYKNGEVKKNCWLKVKGKKTYYLTSDGSRAVGNIEISGKTYNFDEDGKLQ